MTRLVRTISAVLLGGACLLAASAASAVPQTGAVEALTLRPVPGSKGVRETTASIMQRQRRTPPPSSVRARPESEVGRKQLAQNPASPATPGAVTDVSGSGPNILGTGLNFTGATVADSLFLPPDSMGAVGPTQYLMAVNGRIRVFDKTTGALGALNASTDVFFNSVRNNQFTSDPRVRYDRLSGRWFVVMINVSIPNRIMIAVSDGSTITGATVWTFFWFPSDVGCLGDFPTLGIDASALYVGVNDFCGPNLSNAVYDSSQAYVVRKSSVLGAGPAVVTQFEVATPAGGAYTPQGVDNPTGDSAQGYFVGADALLFGKLDVVRISNPGGSPTATQLGLTVAATSFPKNPPQPGSPKLLDAIDDRLTTATLQGGTLWTAHNISVNSSGVASSAVGSRTGIRWYALTNLTATPSVLRTGTVFDSAGANPLFLWMPGLTVSYQGHVALGMSTGGTTAFANAAYGTMLLSDSAFSSPAAYTSASSSYNAQPAETVQRWGDYSNMSVDPCDGQSFWSVDEWAFGPGSWAVQIAKLLAPPPATPATADPAVVPAGSSNVNVQVTGTTTNGAAFFGGIGNPACPFVATVTPGVTVNSASVATGSQVSLNISTVGTVAGTKTVSVTNPDGQSRSAAVLYVVGSLSVSPGIGLPGSGAVVTGASFAPNETVNLSWWTCTPTCQQVVGIGSVAANSSGAFTNHPITIPANTAGGKYFVVAVGATSGGVAFTPFVVLATLSVSPTAGLPGANVLVSGSRFGASESVGLSWWSCGVSTCTNLASLGTTVANASGAFSGKSVTIPAGTAGTYVIVGFGPASGAVGLTPFTVTGGGPARAARHSDADALATNVAGMDRRSVQALVARVLQRWTARAVRPADLISEARSRTPRSPR